MKEVSKERQIRVVGVDLAKRSFHLFGMDEAGKQVLSKKLARARLGAFVANLSPCKGYPFSSSAGKMAG